MRAYDVVVISFFGTRQSHLGVGEKSVALLYRSMDSMLSQSCACCGNDQETKLYKKGNKCKNTVVTKSTTHTHLHVNRYPDEVNI